LFNSKKIVHFIEQLDLCSPYKALFGDDPKVGLSASNLPSDLLKKSTTEEDLEHITQIKETKKTFNCL